jgi:hypothetical protein
VFFFFCSLLIQAVHANTPGGSQSPTNDAIANPSSACQLSSIIPSVAVCSPLAGALVNSPLTLTAQTNDNFAVTSLQLYVDGVQQCTTTYQADMSCYLTLTEGAHTFNVQGTDEAGHVFQATTYAQVE